jgi:uncharacterized protein YndB with AHSA1/START domain
MMKIEKNYDLPFSLERVYSAWVSSDTVIPPATRMDILPEVGGHYRLFMATLDFQSKNEGEFLRVEPNARVTYTWEWNGDGEVSTIDVVFTRTDGGTHIALTHEGLQTAESVANHDAGWDSYIEGFKTHLAKG